jgi:hypothetical protein
VGPCLETLHAKRAGALLRATAALVRGGIASLSAIALSLDGGITLKHSLKSVDRLLGKASAKNARSAREPWLLASSVGLQHLSAEAIAGLYSQRMRIEQSFRDTKNLRLGLGLEAARSRSGKRLEILLPIGVDEIRHTCQELKGPWSINFHT